MPLDRHEQEASLLSASETREVIDLCYQCKLCYNHCPYHPPHEWAIDFPKLMTRAKLRVGFSQEFTFPFINLELRPTNASQYEAPRAAGFLSALGFNPEGTPAGWQLPDQDVRWAQQMIHFRNPQKDSRLVVVDPGMGNRRCNILGMASGMGKLLFGERGI